MNRAYWVLMLILVLPVRAEMEALTGDWGGNRERLREEYGLEFQGGYDIELWSNTTGGIKTGVDYTALLNLGVEVNLETLLGWPGATFHNSWLLPHGTNLSGDFTGNTFATSNIAAYNTFRMFELWLQQNFFEDRLSLRAGQLSADEEFAVSETAGLFLNGTFGWPAFLSESLPNGGSAYPLATPGARLALSPTDWLQVQSGVYQGDPRDEVANNRGFQWDLNGTDGFMVLNELWLLWAQAEESAPLPGTVKLGGWVHTGEFADVSTGRTLEANHGAYLIIDQQLYENPEGGGLAGFARFGYQDNTRNPFDYYADAGLTYTGLIPGRGDDTLGVAFAYGNLSPGTEITLLEGGARGPDNEMVVELTYQIAVNPWFSLQPDVQCQIHPGGTCDRDHAIVAGARASVIF